MSTSYLKSRKGGFFIPQTHGADVARTLMWHARLTWRARPARMRRDTQGHVAEPRKPTQHAGGVGGADPWQEATWIHTGPRGRP